MAFQAPPRKIHFCALALTAMIISVGSKSALADPSVMLPRRSQTITPVQSLSLLNNRFVEQCAQALAERIRREAGEDVDRQIDELYQLLLLRKPEPGEFALARSCVRKQTLLQFCVVILHTNEFLFVQ